jgi:HAMP domain-containing protein
MTTPSKPSFPRRHARDWRERLGTWRSKLVFLLLAFSLLPIGVLSLWQAEAITKIFIDSHLASLTALARAKAGTVEQFVQDRKTEVERIAPLLAADFVTLQESRRRMRQPDGEDLPGLRDAEALEASPEDSASDDSTTDDAQARRQQPLSPALTDLREKLALILWDQSKFEELLIIDSDGRVVASTHAPHEGTSAAEIEYFRAGSGATYLQPIFKSPITGRLSMVVSTPIRNPEAQTVGVLAARLNLGRLFQRINDLTGLGQTGETIVGKQVEREIVFMAPTRHDPEAALERRIPLDSSQGLSLQDALRSQRGSGERVDYRGVGVLAAWEEIPSLEWGMVVKIDRDEVMLPVIKARRQLLVFVLLLIIAALISSVLAARALLAPLHKLERAADQVSRGNLDVDLDIHSRDEIGDLAESFERMVAAIRFFRAHSRESDDDEDEELEDS